jgi:hypothetical protein
MAALFRPSVGSTSLRQGNAAGGVVLDWKVTVNDRAVLLTVLAAEGAGLRPGEAFGRRIVGEHLALDQSIGPVGGEVDLVVVRQAEW